MRLRARPQSNARFHSSNSWAARSTLAILIATVVTLLIPIGSAAQATNPIARSFRGAGTSEDSCHTPPIHGFGFDRYGGWKGLHRNATGRFRVDRLGAGFSLLTPLGNAFFANGATGLGPLGDTIANGSSPYHDAVTARYGTDAAWSDATFQRLCALGMRTMGGWASPSEVDLFAGRLAYTVNIDIYASLPTVTTGPGGNKPRRDAFADDAVDRARTAAHANPLVDRCAIDPWCIGVFNENEQPYAPAIFAGGTHVDVYLSQPAGSPGKSALQRFFAHRYGDQAPARFNEVWGTTLQHWSDFQDLTALGDCAPDASWLDDLCMIDESPARFTDRMDFEAEVAGRVARLADAVLNEIAPKMLNLGPRLVVAPYSRQLLRAIGAPADIVSVNNYDVEQVVNLIFTPAQQMKMDQLGLLSFRPYKRLAQVAAATHKPVWVSEWFYRTARPGMSSFPPFLPERPDATTRADAAAWYLKQLLNMPFVVGESWFQWQDQPIVGRQADGENQLIGVVDIHDDLNQPLAQRLTRLYRGIVDRRFVHAKVRD